MSFNTKPLLDSQHEFIYFTGKISKHVLSKKDEKLIGVNVNDIRVLDKFYKDEFSMIVQKLQKKNVKLYKKEIPRPFLILFAPKTLNRCLENIDKYPVDTYVKFKVDMGHKKIKDKKEEIINVADMELYDNHPKNIEKKYGTGIFINSKFTPVEDLEFNSPALISLLDKIYDSKSKDINDILSLNKLINKWLAKGIELQKKKEYEIERMKLENKKKEEVKQTSEALVKALQSVKSIYDETIQQS